MAFLSGPITKTDTQYYYYLQFLIDITLFNLQNGTKKTYFFDLTKQSQREGGNIKFHIKNKKIISLIKMVKKVTF